MGSVEKKSFKALVVKQWLNEWDEIKFSPEIQRTKPEKYFYVFSLPADYIKGLSDTYRRKANKPRNKDMAIQRTLDTERSEEINRFIHGGYPWSSLSEKQKTIEEFKDLKMPGWLPTVILANILPKGAIRNEKEIKKEDLIQINDIGDEIAEIVLPETFFSEDWDPTVAPLEIIDGQHRIYAIEDEDELGSDYNIPIVAFNNLDFTWQAYLFFTINIKPKRINTSLAYDLFPLLRIQDWLEKSPDGPAVYRETRAQELTEFLWSHPQSPWKGRINMLGERRGGDVTQAAFIRSLLASFLKRGGPIGGLFGDRISSEKGTLLTWNRFTQAAFVIFIWMKLEKAVLKSDQEWASSIRKNADNIKGDLKYSENKKDPAFYSKYSLLTTDQGIRGFHQIINDICSLVSDQIDLSSWAIEQKEIERESENYEELISNLLSSLEKHQISKFIDQVCRDICKFDWRASSSPELNEMERRGQMVYKGSSGYKEIRLQLLNVLTKSSDLTISTLSEDIKQILKY